MKVLITGGTGFVGSNLARDLAENGSEVTIFDNNFRGRFDSYIEDLINDHNIKFINQSCENISEFMIECGSGFYVRSFARDIADKLNTKAHIYSLKRTLIFSWAQKIFFGRFFFTTSF